MKVGPNVERWREIASQELSRQGVPLPVNLVLGVIWTESRGKPGITHPKSKASGIMQVMPNTLKWYNEQNPSSTVSLDTLRSKDHGREQIRVGIWVMAQFWKGAYRYLKNRLDEIPTEQLARIADLFYVAGPGATKKKLDQVEPPFLEAVEARFPKWNALPHPRNVFNHVPSDTVWNLDAISQWLHGSVKKEKMTKGVSILALGVILIIYWYFLREKKNDGESKN